MPPDLCPLPPDQWNEPVVTRPDRTTRRPGCKRTRDAIVMLSGPMKQGDKKQIAAEWAGLKWTLGRRKRRAREKKKQKKNKKKNKKNPKEEKWKRKKWKKNEPRENGPFDATFLGRSVVEMWSHRPRIAIRPPSTCHASYIKSPAKPNSSPTTKQISRRKEKCLSCPPISFIQIQSFFNRVIIRLVPFFIYNSNTTGIFL